MPVQELELISTNEDEKPALQKMGAALLGNASLSQPAASSPPKLVDPNGETLEIPWSVFRALQQVVGSMANGKACSVVPYDPSLDTQQTQNEGVKRIIAWVVSSDRLFDLQEAAGFLTCSESAVLRLLDSDELPSVVVGNKRYIRFGDLSAYRRQRSQTRRKFLDEMLEFAQETGLY